MKPVLVGITGASGILYGIRLVKFLLESGKETAVIVSQPGMEVAREELGLRFLGRDPREIFDSLLEPSLLKYLTIYPIDDLKAPPASGSYVSEATVIIPCSMGTLGAVASGISRNLIHRAADCALKEGRKLVLVPRETPLNAIHLENMLKLARLGVRIVPAMPAFYSGPQSIEDLEDFLVGKVLDQLEIQHALYARWGSWAKGVPS